jgi:hypothetical protein
MFNCDENIRFTSEKSEEEVMKDVENALIRLGNCQVTRMGAISISALKYSNTFANVSIEANLRKSDDEYTLSLEASVQPTPVDWGIGICFFPLGFAVFIMPSQTKDTLARKFGAIANELRR